MDWRTAGCALRGASRGRNWFGEPQVVVAAPSGGECRGAPWRGRLVSEVGTLPAAKSRAYTCRWPELSRVYWGLGGRSRRSMRFSRRGAAATPAWSKLVWRTAGCSRRSLRRRAYWGAEAWSVGVGGWWVFRGEEPRLHLPVAGFVAGRGGVVGWCRWLVGCPRRGAAATPAGGRICRGFVEGWAGGFGDRWVFRGEEPRLHLLVAGFAGRLGWCRCLQGCPRRGAASTPAGGGTGSLKGCWTLGFVRSSSSNFILSR
jgi:hypothetical protein